MRLEPQQAAPSFSAQTVQGQTVTLEQFAGKTLLLKFHRYAACPMCNLALHDFARRFPEFHERGLEAVAFFHSPAESIRAHAGAKHYPFALAADPKFRVYRRYGVETSWPRLILSAFLPKFYLDWVRAMRHGYWGGAAAADRQDAGGLSHRTGRADPQARTTAARLATTCRFARLMMR